MKIRCVSLFLVCFLAICGSGSNDACAGVEEQRKTFLQTETLLGHGRVAEAQAGMEQLRDYPLYPYLKAKQLEQSLDDAAAIRGFLSQYDWTRHAGRLRGKWLSRLGERRAWSDFLFDYRPSSDVGLQCINYLALLQVGRQPEGAAGAAKLWLTGENLPGSCDALFDAWRSSGGLDDTQRWQRYALAMRKNNEALLKRLEQGMSAEQLKWWEFGDAFGTPLKKG